MVSWLSRQKCKLQRLFDCIIQTIHLLVVLVSKRQAFIRLGYIFNQLLVAKSHACAIMLLSACFHTPIHKPRLCLIKETRPISPIHRGVIQDKHTYYWSTAWSMIISNSLVGLPGPWRADPSFIMSDTCFSQEVSVKRVYNSEKETYYQPDVAKTLWMTYSVHQQVYI